jgi:hypothetical protein
MARGLVAAAPRVAWAIGWGTPLTTRDFGKTEHIRAVDSDSQGNVYAVGPSAGPETVRVYGSAGVLASLPGRGGSDIVLVKVKPSGDLVWARSYGGAGDDGAYDVALDGRDFVLITGRTTAAFSFGPSTVRPGGFLAKLDANGEPLWAVAVDGTPNEQAPDARGNIFIARPSGVGKHDPDGRLLWSQALGGGGPLSPNSVRGIAVAEDGSGDALVTGQFKGTITLGGLSLASRGGLDAFVARLRAADGGAVFLNGIGGPDDDYGRGVTPVGAQLFVSGAFSGAIDVFGEGRLSSAGGQDIYVARVDQVGRLLWASAVGGRGHEEGAEISADPRGAVLIGGSFSGAITVGPSVLQSRGGTDLLVAKLGGDETPLWAAAPLGGAASDLAYACGTDGLGGYTFAGGFEGAAQFGGTALTSLGGVDGVFGRIVEDGAGGGPAADAGRPVTPAMDAGPGRGDTGTPSDGPRYAGTGRGGGAGGGMDPFDAATTPGGGRDAGASGPPGPAMGPSGAGGGAAPPAGGGPGVGDPATGPAREGRGGCALAKGGGASGTAAVALLALAAILGRRGSGRREGVRWPPTKSRRSQHR